MARIFNERDVNQDRFVHVKNNGAKDFTGVYNSKHYTIHAGQTELVNFVLYQHFCKAFDGECPLQMLDDDIGSIEYARAKAKQKEADAEQKIQAAQKAAAEAEQAKKELAALRLAAKNLEKPEK